MTGTCTESVHNSILIATVGQFFSVDYNFMYFWCICEIYHREILYFDLAVGKLNSRNLIHKI